MKKSTRILILGLVFEVLLFLLGAWLLNGLATGSLQPTNNAAETGKTILTVLGSAMGVIAGVFGVVWFSLQRKGL